MQSVIQLAPGVNLTSKFDLAHWAKVRQAVPRQEHTPSSFIDVPGHGLIGQELRDAADQPYQVVSVREVWLCGWLTCVILETGGRQTQALSLRLQKDNAIVDAMLARAPKRFVAQDGGTFIEISSEFADVF